MKFKNLQQLFSLFNRKERHHLLDHATRGGMEPSPQFLDQIERAIGVELDHGRVWMAMDYHLDWISAVLQILKSSGLDTLSAAEYEVLGREQLANAIASYKGSNYLVSNDTKKVAVVEGNQQDVDLILLGAEEETEEFHVVLLEAKMDTSWSNDQLETKGKRIAQVLPEGGSACIGSSSRELKFHMVFADPSGKESKNAVFSEFPDWIKSKAGLPEKILIGNRDIWPMAKPTRCDRSDNEEIEFQNWYVEKVDNPS